jgi:hypothetical protein
MSLRIADLVAPLGRNVVVLLVSIELCFAVVRRSVRDVATMR